jgi:hypothetical protein
MGAAPRAHASDEHQGLQAEGICQLRYPRREKVENSADVAQLRRMCSPDDGHCGVGLGCCPNRSSPAASSLRSLLCASALMMAGL